MFPETKIIAFSCDNSSIRLIFSYKRIQLHFIFFIIVTSAHVIIRWTTNICIYRPNFKKT